MDLVEPAGVAMKTSGKRRLGVTVSRRVGNAVVRNRIKRCLREWFRIWREELEQGSVVVLTARPAIAGATGLEISAELCKLFDLGISASGKPVRHRVQEP